MKIFIFIVFALSVAIKANILADVTRGIEPIIMSVGTVLAAIGLDVKPFRNVQLFEIAEYKPDSKENEKKKLNKDQKEIKRT